CEPNYGSAKSISFMKRHTAPAGRFAGIASAFFVCALAAFILNAKQAEARRGYYRQIYSPPAAAMAIDLYSGRILYSKNPNELRYPASLTKVMTLYLLFDAIRDGRLSMKTELKVSANAAAQPPTRLGLSEGDTISVADAVGAIVTKSANDMAVVIAEALAGSEQEFARRMTQKARTIGMLNTTFRNASGLPDPEQKTTAQDLIVLGKNILADHPERCKIFATKYFQYDGQVFQNHNTMLFSYQGMEGMKTGYTAAAGFNLIATARRGDKRLLAVVLGGHSASSRNSAMRMILDSSWPKALTQVAAKKSGIQIASVPPRPVAEAPDQKQPAPQSASFKPAPPPAITRAGTAPILRLKRKPDRVSASILLASIEISVAGKPYSAKAYGFEAANAERGTDEPDDKAERARRSSPAYVPPPAQEVARNETLVAQVMPAPKNISVHYKTGGQPDVTPLEAASLDAPSQMPAEPAKPAQVVRTVQNEEAKQPQTLAAATMAVSLEMDQPGPFHVQVGAFADKDEAKQRLESVRQALGPEIIKAHPDFIVPVSLPTGVTMFRARLSRFANEAQAKLICKRLKSSGIDCWDIRAQ
ncbi:MAG TPA: SPOR domain-containing protein, partial [Hyphomicrobiales bacterium]|nr:SPOR domain-containing protein [Hyphomicrobiales bacterium]